VAVGDLYTISELCGSWQAVYRWQALWQLAICVGVGKLYAAGEVCGSGQAWVFGQAWHPTVLALLSLSAAPAAAVIAAQSSIERAFSSLAFAISNLWI
jgi:hypothetical protein